MLKIRDDVDLKELEKFHFAQHDKVNKDKSFWNDLKYIGVTNKKLPAQLYIDDRAYKYDGQSMNKYY